MQLSIPAALAIWLAASPIALAATASPQDSGGNASTPPSADPATPAGPTGSANQGVIKPPGGVDPAIKTPVPSASAFPTPVIKPPGTPGNPTPVVPK